MSDQGSGVQVSPRMLTAGVVTLLAAVFVVQNLRDSRIEFLWMSIEVGMWVALAVTFLLGLAAGWLVSRSRN